MRVLLDIECCDLTSSVDNRKLWLSVQIAITVFRIATASAPIIVSRPMINVVWASELCASRLPAYQRTCQNETTITPTYDKEAEFASGLEIILERWYPPNYRLQKGADEKRIVAATPQGQESLLWRL